MFELFNSIRAENTLLSTESIIFFLTIYIIHLFFPLTYCHSSAKYVNHDFFKLLIFHGPISPRCAAGGERVYFCHVWGKWGSIGTLTLYSINESKVLGKYTQTENYLTQRESAKFTLCIFWSIFTFQMNFFPQ